MALLKIDIEGAEYYTMPFREQIKMLQAGLIDVILFEMNYTLKRFQLQSAQVCDLLAKHVYYLYEYKTDENQLTKVKGEINIDIQKNYFATRDVTKINARLKINSNQSY